MGDFRFLKNIYFETQDYILKDLTQSDVTEKYLDWFAGPEIKKNISASKHMQDLERVKKYVHEKYLDPTSMFLGIFTKDLKHIGNIKYNLELPREDFMVMGMLIGDEDYRGKGVALQALTITCEYLARHGIKKIYLGVRKDHPGAIKAYSKAGFKIAINTPIPMGPEGHVMERDL